MWFNGAHTNHRSYFEEAPHIDTGRGSPYDTSYGDGSIIPAEELAAIRGDVWRSAVAIQLRTGDVVVVDNALAGHGRVGWDPDRGDRRVLLTHFT